MDLNGNVCCEQRDRSEESRRDTSSDIEKIQLVENEEKKGREIASIRSNDSLKNGDSRNFARNQQYRKVCRRRENYGKMCEHRRDSSCRGNFPDGNAENFTEEIWECTKADLRCDNYGDENGGTGCDANRTNDPYRSCKSGINISVVSRRPTPCENVELEKPMYSVSFKRCYDKNQKWDGKRRKFFSPCSKSKKSKKREASRYLTTYRLPDSQVSSDAIRLPRFKRRKCKSPTRQKTEETADSSSNFRCTFESCCGSCEPYVMELQKNDCEAYKEWQNPDCEPKDPCFEDCCCPREMNAYSSNDSVENEKPCSSSNEPKYDFPSDDCHASSKHGLQRVHFVRAENCAKTDHSSCSFCSRKCTPSKASLFVEIGESVADVCNLASAQAFQCADSMESLKGDAAKRECSSVKRNKSDLLKGRGKSKKSEAKCSTTCKGRPGAVARSYSDRIARMNVCLDDCTIEQMPQEAFCGEMVTDPRSNVSFQEVQDCRAQTESAVNVRKSTTGCSKQCETNEQSLFGDIRKGKIWSQLQDTCKSFVKVATTSIGQIVKQSSKLKRSKKGTKDRLTCGTCTKECESTSCSDQCNQSEAYNDCVYEGTCWQEIIEHESNNCDMHCCRSICYESVAGLPECQTSMCQNDYWKPKRSTQEKISSEGGWRFDSRDSAHGNVYSSQETPSKRLRHPKYNSARKRGGGDSTNQKKKQTSLNKRPNQNSSSKNQIMNQGTQSFPLPDDQTERATLHFDVNVQTNAVRGVVNAAVSPSYITESMEYQKRIRTVKLFEPYSNTTPDDPSNENDVSSKRKDGPVYQETNSTLPSLPPKEKPKVKETRRQAAPPTRRPVQSLAGSRYAPATSTNNYRNTRPEISNRTLVTSTPKKEIMQRDRFQRQNRTGSKTATAGKGIQCMLIKHVQLVCMPSSKKTFSDAQELCSCVPKGGAKSPAKAPVEIAEKEDKSADVTVDTPVEIAEEIAEETDTPVDSDVIEETVTIDAIEKTPVVDEFDTKTVETTEADTTEEASVTQETTEDSSKVSETPDDESKVDEDDVKPVEASEVAKPDDSSALDTTEMDTTRDSIVSESSVDKSKEKLKEEAEETLGSSAIATTTHESKDSLKIDRPEPIEISREFNGRRTFVSVQMQTSNTILTQILSEFEIGNKKRQVLMSIRLHSNLEGNDSDGQQPSGSNDVEATVSEEQSQTSGSLVYDQRKRTKRLGMTRSVHPKLRRPKGAYGSSTFASNNGSTYQRADRSRLRELSSASTSMNNDTMFRKHLRN